ncbi:hypothetical protein C8J56DRAFT_892726 [Mycena floridula]|nr:hypothetical protein C8J56DRAFT_892726 [Mycena floridula]
MTATFYGAMVKWISSTSHTQGNSLVHERRELVKPDSPERGGSSKGTGTKVTGTKGRSGTGSKAGTKSPANPNLQASSSSANHKPPKPKVKGKRDMTQKDEWYCFPFCANRGTQMIVCEDRECEIECSWIWLALVQLLAFAKVEFPILTLFPQYHLKCVGLHAPPPGAAQWFCDVCKARRAATRAERRAGWINPEILKRAEILSYQLADKLRDKIDDKPTM